MDIMTDGRPCLTGEHDATIAKNDCFTAKVLDHCHIVGYEKNGASRATKLVYSSKAFLLERHVAHSEYFIYNENLRIKMRGHSKSKTDLHTT